MVEVIQRGLSRSGARNGSEAGTMAKILAVKTSHRRGDGSITVAAARAEALFVSPLQPSESAVPDQVRRAVTATVRRLGTAGCSAEMAREFGDHPDTAATRMTWALATIRTVYPPRTLTISTPVRRPLALAS
jgi:hypothetical protein